MNFLRSDEQLEALVNDFEHGRLVRDQWHHAEHIAICFWYLCKRDFLETVFRLKLGILSYNLRDEIRQTPERGYHETITMFFIKFVKSYVDKIDLSNSSLVEKLTPFIEQNRNFLETLWSYYSKENLNSIEARIRWIEPDIRSL